MATLICILVPFLFFYFHTKQPHKFMILFYKFASDMSSNICLFNAFKSGNFLSSLMNFINSILTSLS
ncbi:MAG: hypothetical protein EGR71_08285 [Clostridiales bacterium]|nr:hypothetical protein [Clostridiales bacterium]